MLIALEEGVFHHPNLTAGQRKLICSTKQSNNTVLAVVSIKSKRCSANNYKSYQARPVF
jgi:hypothetical protein